MSRKGESIFKRNDNRYEARYIKGYDKNGKAKYGYVYAKTYNEAKKKRNEILLNIEKKEKKILGNLKEQINLWLKNQKYSVKESTYAHYVEIINNHIIPYFQDISLKNINKKELIEFNNYLLQQGNKRTGKGLSPKTVKDINVVLQEILKFADIHISIKNPKIDKKKICILTKKEQQILEQYIINNIDSYKLGIMITLYTGLRLGEICALKWKNIDLENRTITINNTILRIKDIDTNNKSKIIINDPKTNSSIREIPINSNLYDLLKDMYSDSEYYVLTNSTKYIEPRNYYKRYKRILRIINLNNFNFHALRHTFATRCIEVGFDAKSLSEVLGHSNVKTTLSLYVHPTMDTKKIFIERLTN